MLDRYTTLHYRSLRGRASLLNWVAATTTLLATTARFGAARMPHPSLPGIVAQRRPPFPACHFPPAHRHFPPAHRWFRPCSPPTPDPFFACASCWHFYAYLTTILVLYQHARCITTALSSPTSVSLWCAAPTAHRLPPTVCYLQPQWACPLVRSHGDCYRSIYSNHLLLSTQLLQPASMRVFSLPPQSAITLHRIPTNHKVHMFRLILSTYRVPSFNVHRRSNFLCVSHSLPFWNLILPFTTLPSVHLYTIITIEGILLSFSVQIHANYECNLNRT